MAARQRHRTVTSDPSTGRLAARTQPDGVKTKLGGCDINYLTGLGTVSNNLEDGTPIKGKFKPMPLKEWSTDRRPKACDF